MKKILLFLAVTMMAICPQRMWADDTETIEWDTVYNAKQFYSVINNNKAANVKLAGNIDLSGHSANDDCIFNITFSGRIDGQFIDAANDTVYYTLMNSSNDLLFNDLSGAEITNLIISNCSFDGWDSHSGWLGTQAYNCKFENVFLSKCSGTGSNTWFDNDYIGGLVGISHNCTFTTVYSVASSIKTDGTYAGLIVGKDEGSTFKNCFTGPTSSIWACGSIDEGTTGAAFCGGICGYASGSTFKRCYNEALVSSQDDKTGGIVGYGTNVTLRQCQNYGMVLNTDEDGYSTMKNTIATKVFTYSRDHTVLTDENAVKVDGAILVGAYTAFLAWGFANAGAPVADFAAMQIVHEAALALETTQEFVGGAAATSEVGVTGAISESASEGSIILADGSVGGDVAGSFISNSAWEEGLAEAAEGGATATGEGATGTAGLDIATSGSSAVPSCIVATGAVILTAVMAGVTAYTIYHNEYAADELGGIAGNLYQSTVYRCTNYGAITAQDQECGGIVGYSDGTTISSCLNRGLVFGETKVGGIAGYGCNGTILKGNVNVAGISAITGAKDKWGYICYDEKDASAVTFENNYYVSSQNAGLTGYMGATPEKFATGSIALALNTAMGDSIWRQDLGSSMYPIPVSGAPVVTATTDNPCLADTITSADDFYIGVSNPYARLCLQADIDLSGMSCVNMSSEDSPFMGTIDGNGHTISNITYEVPYPESTDWTNVNAALFPFAKNATFKNFILKNCIFTQEDFPEISFDKASRPNCEALLVAQSNGCTYDSITLKNCDIYHCNEWLRWVGGLVSLSTNDTFTDCSVEKGCTFQAKTGTSCNDALLGGIAGKATGCTFTRCYNGATIEADDEKVGGLVGTTEGSGNVFSYCLNTGSVSGHEYTGGIVGLAYNATISYCVNTGTLYDDKNDRQDWRGGIVGCLSGSSSSVDHSMNFGSVNYAEDNCGEIGGLDNGATNNGNNYYYCLYNGEHSDNTESTTDATYAMMLSGAYAFNATDADGNKWLYQDIDGASFSTNMPNPIPAAGTVYSNILCDGTQSYSNDFQSTESHTGTADQFGYCTTCGTLISDPASEIHITNAEELIKFANIVNAGRNVSKVIAYLDNDLDMTDVSFTPIGDYPTYPYKGTFDGQGHRIKNLTVSNTSTNSATGTGVGFFGCVSDTAAIRNLIIDKTCTFTGSHYGTAGIVGCLALASDESTDSIHFTMQNCGNEATVSGNINAAGLIGGVYNTDDSGKSKITIENCYNAGTITGSEQSAAFIGYANHDITVTNCYNTGTVTGYDTDHSLISYKDDATVSCSNVYNLSTLASDTYATTVTKDTVSVGALCQMLNKTCGSNAAWTQDIYADTIPTFGTNGVKYSRSMADNWGTVCLPFDVTISNDAPYSFMTLAAVNDSTLTVKELTGTLKAGTPAFIHLDEAAKDTTTNYYSYELVANSDLSTTVIPQDTIQGLSLTGLFSLTDITGKSGYILLNGKLYNIANMGTVKRNRFNAYLAGSLTGSPQSLTLLQQKIYISNATELNDFASSVNSGTNYAGVSVYLTNDIDMSGEKGYTPIGTDSTYSFKGNFYGQGYRIKNLVLSQTDGYTGFFGCVAGLNTVIANLIIDSSCSITSTAEAGTAGLIGCIESVDTLCNVTIINCANEAAVTGTKNTAGILGGVYSNDNTYLSISNCYNTGAITGTTESAAICGYARNNYNITNSYNTGTLTGGDASSCFYRAAAEGTQLVTNCYDTNGSQDGVTQITSDQVRVGELYQLLNTNRYVTWFQDLGEDNSHPTYGSPVMIYTRSMTNIWGTIVLPFDVTITDNGPYDFYQLSSVSGNTLTLSKMSGTLAAGTPAIIRMSEKAYDKKSGKYELSLGAEGVFTTIITNPEAVDGLTLTGVYTTADVTDKDAYIIKDNTFWKVADAKGMSKVYCDPFHAYLAGTASSGAKQLFIGIGDDTPTAVGEVLNSLSSGEGWGEIYDLDGRRVNDLQHGVNIVKYGNGATRKVILK